MKTFKKCVNRVLFMFLTIAYMLLACSCSIGDDFDNSTQSFDISSGEICNYEDSKNRKNSSCGATEQIADFSAIVINSLAEEVLHLKINTKDDELSCFVDSIKSNPIDLDFEEDVKGINNANELWHLIEHKYIPILMIDINQAVDDLSFLVGEDFGLLIGEYVALCIDAAEKRLACETQLFVNGDSGIYLGQYVRLGIYTTYFDAYRQLLFNLKYWTYIIEIENYGTSTKSLKFIHDSDVKEKKDIVLIYYNDIIIETKLSPSYTKDDAIDFISEQKEKIIYCLDENYVELLTVSYLKTIRDMTNDAIHQTVLMYCESCYEQIDKEIEVYSYLKNNSNINSCADLNRMSQKDKFSLSSVVGYWAFIIEQEVTQA